MMRLVISSLADSAVAERLIEGQVGVMPTDTVMGLVAVVKPESVARLYEIKTRGPDKPGTMIAASVTQLEGLGIPKRYLSAVEQYWPGAVSVVIPAGSELDFVHGGGGTVAVRIPDDAELLSLLELTGPLLTSSANMPGSPIAEDINAAWEYFGDKADFYVKEPDDRRPVVPSTVIRIVDDAVEVLRRGAVDIDEAGRVVSI